MASRRGILFMANDKSLVSFSLISSFWQRYKKDTIDLLTPFVLYSFSDLYDDPNIVSLIETKRYIEKEFCPRMLKWAIWKYVCIHTEDS